MFGRKGHELWVFENKEAGKHLKKRELNNSAERVIYNYELKKYDKAMKLKIVN
jgi:hypothetical protein